ncbi:MAG: glycogen/starch synthase [Bacteroidales bacterium]|nr:glycogen/starch synthase [Bacteroidales bacterium]
MEGIKVLFVAQEITPYLPETEMSVISRNLPQGIQDLGKEIRTFMPRYGCINERRNQLHEVIRLSGMNIIIDDTDHSLIIKVASIQAARMQVYFIDNEDYFQRKFTLQDDSGNFFEDNDERAIFFARGVLETVKKLQWSPDIIHCHGWFTGLIPLYIKKVYYDDPLFMDSRVILSLYDNEFNKPLNKSFKSKLESEGIAKNELSVVEDPTYENFCKLAIDFSDGIIMGSEKINKTVEEYIKANKKSFLSFQGPENYITSYSEYYDKIITATVND